MLGIKRILYVDEARAHNVILTIIVFILAMGQGCSSTGNRNGPANDFVTNGKDMEGASYKLGSNDVVRIQVFDEPDLTTETEVSGQGTIKFPLLGELHIGGMDVKEVESYVTEQLKGGYLKRPKVSVYIVKHRNIYVNGEVRLPGAYAYDEGLTVLKAITLAGGFTAKAAQTRTILIRKIEGREVESKVNLDDLVRPDDIIVVPESFF